MNASDEPPDDLRVRLKWPGMPDLPTDDPGIRLRPRVVAPEPAVHDDAPVDDEPIEDDPKDDYATYEPEPEPEPADVADAEVDYPTGDDAGGSDNGEAAPPGTRKTVTTQELILAGRSDSLQAALASIALRIDALTSTTSTFRNLVSDRLTDYSEQVGRLAAGAAGDLDDYRHLHERSLEQIRRSVGEAEDNLRKLSRTVTDLEVKTGTLVAAVRENGDAVDHLLTERDQVSDALLRSLDRVGLQVQAGLDHGLGDTMSSLARLEEALAEVRDGAAGTSVERLDEIVDALVEERDRQLAVSAQLEETLVTLADDRELGADAIARLEQAITTVTAAQDRGLAKLATRLDARLDQLAGGLHGVAGDDLTAILTRLDARLKELSTELVSGRDRETAKAVGLLSAQLDGLAGMVAEAGADRQPIQARLDRLVKAAPPAPDLSELSGRLDGIAATLAQYEPPDLRDLHLHIDELGQTVSRQSVRVDPKLTNIIERLERLVPALEGGPTRRARLGDPASASVSEDRRELLDRIDQLGEQLGGSIEALRRRIALRARPASQELDDKVIAAIADAVIARLGATEPPELRPPPPQPALARPSGMVSGEQRRRGPGRP